MTKRKPGAVRGGARTAGPGKAVGRPAKVGADAKLDLRAPRAEIEAWRAQAKAEGVSLSAWVRARCNAARG
jgi:predicted HicB family RNase H-like nuclease